MPHSKWVELFELVYTSLSGTQHYAWKVLELNKERIEILLHPLPQWIFHLTRLSNQTLYRFRLSSLSVLSCWSSVCLDLVVFFLVDFILSIFCLEFAYLDYYFIPGLSPVLFRYVIFCYLGLAIQIHPFPSTTLTISNFSPPPSLLHYFIPSSQSNTWYHTHTTHIVYFVK